MAIIFAENKILQNILTEVQKMDKVEQKSILAYIRAMRIVKSGKNPVPVKAVKKTLTMAQIDRIKHLARKK